MKIESGHYQNRTFPLPILMALLLANIQITRTIVSKIMQIQLHLLVVSTIGKSDSKNKQNLLEKDTFK
ncbi:MAG: hypothetical protein BRD49_01970 [Bacteroidetes bacterium SW_10_40_5]|nr:MAG: hypothetical protein BRD49_01970 [Bacteroidetes bacterium SW_10_40_5]